MTPTTALPSPPQPDPRGERSDATRGAVFVEFLIAFMPLLVFFTCLSQLGNMYAAQVITFHSAYTGARAAAVVLDDDPAHYNGEERLMLVGERADDVERAVALPIRANRAIVSMDVTYPTAPGGDDSRTDYRGVRDGDLVRVHVSALYRCRFPIADRIVCGWDRMRRLEAEAALPVNAAPYEYPDGGESEEPEEEEPEEEAEEEDESSVWDLTPFERGQVIEGELYSNLPENFPTIDRFIGGTATSIKSINLRNQSYQTTSGLGRQLNRYIDDLAGFDGATAGGTTVNGSDITGRVLELAIPPEGPTAAQQAAIDAAVAYGASRGVQVKVITID